MRYTTVNEPYHLSYEACHYDMRLSFTLCGLSFIYKAHQVN